MTVGKGAAEAQAFQQGGQVPTVLAAGPAEPGSGTLGSALHKCSSPKMDSLMASEGSKCQLFTVPRGHRSHLGWPRVAGSRSVLSGPPFDSQGHPSLSFWSLAFNDGRQDVFFSFAG